MLRTSTSRSVYRRANDHARDVRRHVTPQTEGDLATHIIVDGTDRRLDPIPITGRIVTADVHRATGTLDVGTFCVNQPTASVEPLADQHRHGDDRGLATDRAEHLGFRPRLHRTDRVSRIAACPRRPRRSRSRPSANRSRRRSTAIVTWTTDVAAAPTATTDDHGELHRQAVVRSRRAVSISARPVHLFTDDGQRVILQNCNAAVLRARPADDHGAVLHR